MKLQIKKGNIYIDGKLETSHEKIGQALTQNVRDAEKEVAKIFEDYRKFHDMVQAHKEMEWLSDYIGKNIEGECFPTADDNTHPFDPLFFATVAVPVLIKKLQQLK